MLLPIAKYGRLIVVDREEIKCYRATSLLLRDYINSSKDHQKPLSLAVFGPPGSGKSFGIKELIGTFKKEISEILEFNLSQFSRPEELSAAFLQISSAGKSGVPVAFFDEFDSTINEKELGWLSYFLAPMQDGKIISQGNEHNIVRSIFIFAGGTSHSFRGFTRENDSSDEQSEFAKAKGPDFASRLAGHVNVLGVNRQEGVPDQSYVIRRAIIIRAEFEQRKLVGKTKRALVDREFVRRLIEVGVFKHGARSVNKVLEMCIGADGMLHIPPAEQLAMHIGESDVERLLKFSGN